MLNHPIPARPLQSVAADLFECDGNNDLSLQDYYSRYIEADRFYSTRTSFVVMKMKGIVARHGIPERVVIDNGLPFAYAEFREFAKTSGFAHSTSNPRYSQSNGLVEKVVHTTDRNMVKATQAAETYTQLYSSIVQCLSRNAQSHMQLLMSRRLRYIQPTTQQSLQPSIVNPEIIQTTGGYEPAIVTEQANTPRSYSVRTNDGAAYRRTSRHLNKQGHYQGDMPHTDSPYGEAQRQHTDATGTTTRQDAP